jgi:DnaJ-class molecular chaperone
MPIFACLTYFSKSLGVDNGETLRMVGFGGADPEGAHPGDLYVALKVKRLKHFFQAFICNKRN